MIDPAHIPFNKPYMTGKELHYISQAHAQGHLAGDGVFSKKCQAWLEEQTGCRKALLTHSCTAALEISAILANIRPGDEVIMPSFTFVSTANAFVLRGAVPVFVEIRPDTLNLDESRIEEAITAWTVAIVVVHYAGVACEMDEICAIASRHGLLVIEDDAQGVGSSYKGRPLGSLGDLAAVSFHETKNVISGEGGALLINSEPFIERAEIIREKGTNRSQFFRGQVDKYTWVDLGSSFLPSDILAAFLLAQLEEVESITRRRLEIWQRYHQAFRPLDEAGHLRRPIVPEYCVHNAHMYHLLLRDLTARTRFINRLRQQDILAVFHYVPLHSSPMGRRVGRTTGELPITDNVSQRLVRMPLWLNIEPHLDRVIAASIAALIDG
jgi:dTDP-4-amino-4,6-dideoxygalactose transaminase